MYDDIKIRGIAKKMNNEMVSLTIAEARKQHEFS